MRRLERAIPSASFLSAYRPWQPDVRSDPAILFPHTAGAAELDLAAKRLGTRTGLALTRLYGKTRKHGLNGSDLTSDCHGLELALVDASGITRSSRLTECSAVGACAGFPLGVFRERKSQRHQDTGDVDRLRPPRRLPIRWHKVWGSAGTVATNQAMLSSLTGHPKKREACLSPEPQRGEVEFRSAGWPGKEDGRLPRCPHSPRLLSIGAYPPARKML